MSLTDLDGTGKSLAEVTVHGAGVLAHETAGTGRVLLPGVGDTGHTTETSLELAVVGSRQVSKGRKLGSELGLGSLECRLSSSGGTTEGSVLASNNGHLGSGREGTGSRATHASHLATEHGELEASALGESGRLLGSGSLVGVEDSTELATGTLGLGVTDVGSRDNTANLLVHTAVDADLVGLIVGNLARHNGDLTLDASLRLLDGGGEGRDLDSHLLASEADSSSGLVADGTDVLHRLA